MISGLQRSMMVDWFCAVNSSTDRFIVCDVRKANSKRKRKLLPTYMTLLSLLTPILLKEKVMLVLGRVTACGGGWVEGWVEGGWKGGWKGGWRGGWLSGCVDDWVG